MAASFTPFDVQEVHLSRSLLAASNSEILKSFYTFLNSDFFVGRVAHSFRCTGSTPQSLAPCRLELENFKKFLHFLKPPLFSKKNQQLLVLPKKMVTRHGFEPWTLSLKGRCSTAELTGQKIAEPNISYFIVLLSMTLGVRAAIFLQPKQRVTPLNA